MLSHYVLAADGYRGSVAEQLLSLVGDSDPSYAPVCFFAVMKEVLMREWLWKELPAMERRLFDALPDCFGDPRYRGSAMVLFAGVLHRYPRRAKELLAAVPVDDAIAMLESPRMTVVAATLAVLRQKFAAPGGEWMLSFFEARGLDATLFRLWVEGPAEVKLQVLKMAAAVIGMFGPPARVHVLANPEFLSGVIDALEGGDLQAAAFAVLEAVVDRLPRCGAGQVVDELCELEQVHRVLETLADRGDQRATRIALHLRARAGLISFDFDG